MTDVNTDDVSSVIQHQEENPLDETKTLKQHEIAAMIKGAKAQAAEKTRKEVQMEYEAKLASMQNSIGGMPQVSEEQLRKMVDETAEKKLQHMMTNLQATQVANNFHLKMAEGKKHYPDFDQVVGRLGDMGNIPDIVQLATNFDNTHDIMYDLAKNPQKIVQIRNYSMINPHLAADEMQKLSASIKANKTAEAQQAASEPLDALKPSINSGGGAPRTDVSYFKQKYRT